MFPVFISVSRNVHIWILTVELKGIFVVKQFYINIYSWTSLLWLPHQFSGLNWWKFKFSIFAIETSGIRIASIYINELYWIWSGSLYLTDTAKSIILLLDVNLPWLFNDSQLTLEASKIKLLIHSKDTLLNSLLFGARELTYLKLKEIIT